MGGSHFSDAAYATRSTTLKIAGIAGITTEYSHKIEKGEVEAAVHPQMNPYGVKVRESRDSAAHPLSRSVVILNDVTGSMREIPVTLREKLGGLMNILIKKGYLEHPQILIAAVGDAKTDKAALQVGQFESGNEIDDDMQKLFLEGGGGGQDRESYELGMYFMARHTSMDCLEKRKQKGYLFIIGDEMCYTEVIRTEVQRIIGDDGMEANIPTVDIATELKEKFDVFVLIPAGAQNSGKAHIRKSWTEMFGEQVLILNNPDDVCEVISTCIGINEEKTDLEKAAKELEESGTSAETVSQVSKSIGKYAASKSGAATAVAYPPPKTTAKKPAATKPLAPGKVKKL